MATHYNIYVDQKQSNGSWKSNYKTYFYAASPYAMDTLPAGTYRVRVQSANANNWTYSNSDWRLHREGQLPDHHLQRQRRQRLPRHEVRHQGDDL